MILDGRTPVRALLDELSDTNKYIFDFRVDSNNNITDLLFAHRTSLDMIRKYGAVLLMDCTYKTNKFKMPLLEVTGVTSFWTTFFCCFVFVAEENQEHYEWALNVIKRKLYNGHHPVTIATDRELALVNAIRSVFPSTNNVLCLWHIQKNLLANCKNLFGDDTSFEQFMEGWNMVVKSLEVDEFFDAWDAFKARYGSTHGGITYIESNWLEYKELFGTAWTRRFLHFGSTTTSRVEGAHHAAKMYIKVSTGHLRDVQQKIDLAVVNQTSEINAQMMRERIRIPHTHRIGHFEQVVGKISNHALGKTLDQIKKISEPNFPPCTHSFTVTLGKSKKKV
jgi:hypothetical protein